MQSENKLNFLFVINPVSGGKTKDDWNNNIQAYFQETPHQIDFLTLNGENDEEKIQECIRKNQPDRIVAVGGDGTIKLVAEQILEKEIPLGILPAGSANGMARELGLSEEPEAALDVLLHGMPQPIDVIQINGKDICLHLSDIGLNAQLVKYYQVNKWRGKLGYARGVLRVLLRRRLLHVRIKTENKVINRAAFMIVLANARMYGTGAIINPDGNPQDGLFEVVVMRQIAFWEFLKMFWRFRPFDNKKIEIIPATSIHIETKKKAYFQIDGEYRGRIKEVEAVILPGKLKVLLPVQ
ncbi:diacylglycerol/lipid kinase family protein [Tellurirhabdus bombi]|uniref:diacylglycerol/lipid kinase family protein n=1 Tax=Tellurirhabdus bombi TaxID=2907205 RepID=UPI001F29D979|nr:diacylglycerol kinase family protein [Tellurirhabdus bombi]